jgi:membrane protease YdiL (CAAX protease family)
VLKILAVKLQKKSAQRAILAMTWANGQKTLLLQPVRTREFHDDMNNYLSKFRDFVSGSSAWYKLLFVCFLLLVFFMLTGILGLVTVMIGNSLTMQEAVSILNNPGPAEVPVLKLSQALQTIGLFIGTAWLAAFFLSPSAGTYLKIKCKPSFFSLFLVVLSMITWIPAINFAAHINAGLDLPESMDFVENEMEALRNSYNQLTELFLNTGSVRAFLVNILVMAILPALGEELLFRGVFQRLLTEWTRNIHLGILLAALLFSFFHFEFFGFLPRFLLGVFFGYLFAWTSSIWVPILAHFTNNFIIVCYSFYKGPTTGPSPIEELGTHADLFLWISLAGGILASALLLFHEKSRRFSGK